MTEQPDVIAALTADGAQVDGWVSGLDAEGWATPTPAPGWTVHHQIAHLAATFRLAGLAAGQPQVFEQLLEGLGDDFDANVKMAMQEFLELTPEALFDRWQAEKATAEQAIAAAPQDEMLPWLVRPLPPPVLAMAGMMELFAHGQDIADALGIRPERTDRLAFLVGFAVRVWDFGYQARGLETPDVEFRWEITLPSGAPMTFGPEDAEQRISGPAEDFCLLVTRRRHKHDLDVTAVGPDAEAWLNIAQAYRGPAGEGRKPGQFATATV